jgi:hypothetical protein
MDPPFETLSRVALVGLGATAVMDLWLLVLHRLGVARLNFALLGRWVGHWHRGVFVHDAIARSPAVRGEHLIGWCMHYATGVAFAALHIGLCGAGWTRHPTLAPALALGIGTVALPWLVMQPAMGSGVAFSRTPSPLANRVRSLANHAVFGLGLYAAARLLAQVLT